MNRMPFLNTRERGTDSHAVTATQDRYHNLRSLSVKVAIIAAIIVLSAALSGCVPGRGGIQHNYNTGYGSGTVYYETGRPTPPPPPPGMNRPPKPPKPKKPKAPKHNKHDKHNNHDKPGKHGNSGAHRR